MKNGLNHTCVICGGDLLICRGYHLNAIDEAGEIPPWLDGRSLEMRKIAYRLSHPPLIEIPPVDWDAELKKLMEE